ncbi:MAG: ABC transporter permease subunit [Deinococcota bacterium]|nr:ABC transporter permease subunit [Deinococcota bacterium]MDQ3459262.1 ABC transporter permease subunit [Deinococcota bacterium]
MILRKAIVTVIPFVTAMVAILVVWKLVALFTPSYLLPPPERVFGRFQRALDNPEFFASIGRSLVRLATGFAVASLLGVGTGLLASAVAPFRAYARAFLAILQSVPPIAYLPLLILLLGFGDKAVLWVITFAALFPIAINAVAAVEQVSGVYVAAARNLGAGPRQLALWVYLPAALPVLIAGAQAGFGNAWRALIAAEMFGGTNIGLGWSIASASQVGDVTGVLLGIAVIGFLSVLIDGVGFSAAKRLLLPWRYA